MTKKTKTIRLVVPKYGMVREFDHQLAERLLRMGTPANGGWVLPEDSKYTYTKENGLRVKSDKGNTAEAK